MTAADRRRLDRLGELARSVDRAERALDRALDRAREAGFSLRELEQATGIPRATLARRLENGGS